MLWLVGISSLVFVGCADGPTPLDASNRGSTAPLNQDGLVSSTATTEATSTTLGTTTPESSTTTTGSPTTAGSPTISSRSSPTSTVPSTSVATPSVADVSQPGSLAGLLAGQDWERSGIERSCVNNGGWCTQVVHDPTGVPVSFDPATRSLMRHVREDGDFVRAVLPESYVDPGLVAAGPDDVVYLNVSERLGAEGSADLVAVTLSAGDAGREVGRVAGGVNPGSDFDFVVTPQGLVTTDWYGPGQRPAADRLVVMPWIDRDPDDDDSPAPGADSYPNGVASINIDAYEHLVSVDDRTWELTGEAAEFPQTGMPPIVRTFDGGFIGRFDEVVNDYRSVVVRGWPDGTVDEWVVPGRPDGLGWTVVPEPMGTVLIAHGEWFARAAPFGPRPAAWDGQLDVDVEAGTVDVTELNDYLSTLDRTTHQPWDIDPVAFASAVVGMPSSPAELVTINHDAGDDDRAVVTVTNERFLDDSVYAVRLTMSISSDLRSVRSMKWANSCQPRRGHQDFQLAYCR